jgi:hypothetical protein
MYTEISSDTHYSVNTDNNYCQKARDIGYTCVDATPVKGLNGELIQLGTTKKTGACPRCLS